MYSASDLTKRPKAEETEEEILEQEKAFLQSLSKKKGEIVLPAAKASRTYLTPTTLKSGPSNSMDIDCANDDTDHEDEITSPHKVTEEANILQDPDETVMSFGIVEREFDSTKLQPFNITPTAPTASISIKPFTKLQIRSSSNGESTGGQKPKSLFAKSFELKFEVGKSKGEIDGNPTKADSSSNMKDPVRPTIGDEIHPYLSGMSEEDILHEQKQLLEKLDPKLVEFVKSRKHKQEQNPGNLPSAAAAGTSVVVDLTEGRKDGQRSSTSMGATTDKYDDLPINPKTVEQYPGMNKVELDKLAWTRMLNDDRPTAAEKLPVGQTARFNFQGILLSVEALKDPSSFEKGLHNHGEEMERPGYSLEELMTLSMSLNPQQKAMALQTIGNIFLHAHTGMYDLVFDKSLFQLLDYMDLIYTIRKGIDETDKTLVNIAISCLANLIFPLEEEVCLDIVYLWDSSKPHPWISTKSDNKIYVDADTPEEDLKDEEILKLDLLEFLIHRSNLLKRIQYLMSNPDILTENGVEGILKILIRISRHSPNVLMGYPELLKAIVEFYVCPLKFGDDSRPVNLRGIPQQLAFKIIRILIDSNPCNAAKLYDEFEVIPVVMSILANDDWKSTTIIKMPEQLLVECFRIWIALLNKGLGMDEYLGFFPVLIKFVIQYMRNDSLSSFDLVHSGYLFALLYTVLRMKEDSTGVNVKDKHSHWNLVKDIVSIAEEFVTKLLNIVISPHLKDSYDEDSLFLGLANGLRFLVEGWKQSNNISTKVVNAVKEFLSSPDYSRITSYLKNQSVILGGASEKFRYANNFASVNAVQFGGSFHPLMILGIKLPLIVSLYSVQRSTCNFQVLNAINDNTKDYIMKVIQLTKRRKAADFFVRYELALIYELIHLFPIDSLERFSLAYKAVSETPKCCSRLFNEFFKLALSASCKDDELEEYYKIYGGYLLECDNETKFPQKVCHDDSSSMPSKKVKFAENTKVEDGPSINVMEFSKWTELCIDAHWILEPLNRIHVIVINASNVLAKNLSEIEMQCKVCVKMIEKCLRQHSDVVIQTAQDFVDVYSKLCLIFLMGDPRIYFDHEISTSLTRILELLINCRLTKEFKDKPIYLLRKQHSEDIPDVFSDLYSNLVKEYEENSYFSKIFAAYLMIPLRIPEQTLLKSNFWTMDNLHYIKIRIDECPVSVQFLTTGLETDGKLLEMYLGLVRSRRINQQSNEFLFEVLKIILTNAFKNFNEMHPLSALKESFLNLKI